MRRRRRWLAAAALALAVALGLLFTPVRVDGDSMRPSLEDGDLLLTRPLWLGAPERFDLVVFEDPDGRAAVKRVAGLPGEELQLLAGDLWADGRRVVREVRGVEDLLPLARARGAGADRVFRLSETGFVPEGGGWRLAGTGLAGVREPWRLDDLLRAAGRRGEDLGLAVRYRLEGPRAVLELRLWEGSAAFRLLLGEEGRRAELSLLQDGETAVLAVAPDGPPAPGGVLFLANVDQHLVAALDGRLLFPPLEYPPVAARRFADRPEFRFEQVAVGGRGPLWIGAIRLGSDLSWPPTGTWACREPLHLAGDEYFLLGDDPAHSTDSRSYGPVPRERLRGVVVGRLLPPGPVGLGW